MVVFNNKITWGKSSDVWVLGFFFHLGRKKGSTLRNKTKRKNITAGVQRGGPTYLQGVKALLQVGATLLPLPCGSVEFAPPVNEFFLLVAENSAVTHPS